MSDIPDPDAALARKIADTWRKRLDDVQRIGLAADIQVAIRAFRAEGAKAEREACANEIPATWLDPLLTGAQAVVGKPPFGCPAVERLLRGIAERIRARGQQEADHA